MCSSPVAFLQANFRLDEAQHLAETQAELGICLSSLNLCIYYPSNIYSTRSLRVHPSPVAFLQANFRRDEAQHLAETQAELGVCLSSLNLCM